MPRFAGRQPAHGMEAIASLAEVAAELNISKQRGYCVGDLIDALHVPADRNEGTRGGYHAGP